ncbi:APC family permease [Marinirhabdus gelatinilytica]|uniref:Amino acid:proton symporter (ABT family) n=1 Tax=Marinirhabdus gelatinilytica TaxID=1703343 RepID=A0A370QK71_9FLAO|nr:APC family permease [Marinirhabdus gelatinilytica]RDK88773.1 hypothetical protein C8D94_101650 [Marinirhabdus gelatinilytica]
MGKEKFGLNATWSMAVGGMVGGGIFSVLGVVIMMAGQWAWLSFILAGGIALISAHSYNQLSLMYKKGGGAFLFLNEIGYKGTAASLSWILILGYILTLSVYAFTFGEYVAHIINFGAWLPRVLSVLVIVGLALVNLRGAGNAAKIEIITVWGKVLVLGALAIFGICMWQPEQLTEGIETMSWHRAIVGAATIFVAYEGFQLLSYDYKDIKKPSKTLPRATISAVLAVMLIYVLVSLGATMLVGAETLVQKKEIALSVAGEKAFGIAGLIIVTIAAAFSTGSAINATMFSTARLIESVANQDDLPKKLSKENKAMVPANAIWVVSAFAMLLAVIGSLEVLVDAASLIFLITFGIVNVLAYKESCRFKWVSVLGALGCGIAIVLSVIEQIKHNPIPLFVFVGLVVLAFVLRPFLLKQICKNR